MARRPYRAEITEDEGDTGQPCACGRHCAEGDYQGNPKTGPRAFCGTDETYIGAAIGKLPETYASLRLLLARSQQAGERVSGSREAPIPLATDVEAFMRELVHIALSWEDQVRAVAKLSDYPEGRRRDAVALAAACKVLRAHLGTLLSLAPEDKIRYVPWSRLDEEPGLPVFFDTSGDAWESVALDGTAAGLEFLRLSGRARGMQGLNRQRRRITEVPCDGCSATTLVQYEALNGGWEPSVKCTNCPTSYIGSAFELLSGRIYEAQLRALAEDARRRATAAAA